MICALSLSLVAAASVQAGEKPAQAPEAFDLATVVRLLEIRRVFVDRLGGGETASQIRDMIIGSLQSGKLFVITEKEERADAVLRVDAAYKIMEGARTPSCADRRKTWCSPTFTPPATA